MIQSLGWHRYKLSEIAESLNSRGYSAPKGGKYYKELIGATLFKMKKRQKRANNMKVEVSNISFWLGF